MTRAMRIEVHRLFRYGMAPKERLHAGIYKVPEELDAAIAEAAVGQGFASVLPEVKGPAPANKARGHVPETKSS